MSRVSGKKKVKRIDKLLAKIEQAQEDYRKANTGASECVARQEWDDLVVEATEQASTVKEAGKVYSAARPYSQAKDVARDCLEDALKSNPRQARNSHWALLFDLSDPS